MCTHFVSSNRNKLFKCRSMPLSLTLFVGGINGGVKPDDQNGRTEHRKRSNVCLRVLCWPLRHSTKRVGLATSSSVVLFSTASDAERESLPPTWDSSAAKAEDFVRYKVLKETTILKCKIQLSWIPLVKDTSP